MRTKLHLISAPWSNPISPSVQVGALKAYSDQVFGGEIETASYSAHLAIPATCRGVDSLELFRNVNTHHAEFPYLLLFYKRFILPSLKGKERLSLSRMIEDLNADPNSNIPLHEEVLTSLQKATDKYLDTEVIPHLIKNGVNVIGLTLNFWQLYASLYIQRYLEEKAPTIRKIFLYGGYGASAPLSIAVLEELGKSGYRVIGEGEKKLELILKACLDARIEARSKGLPQLEVDGVISLAKKSNHFDRSEKFFKSQFADISLLPQPDYDEYFATVKRIKKHDPLLNIFENFALPVEGSRGCFAHCDFCTLNSQWRGFRKLPAETVYERTMNMVDRYGCSYVFFVDTVSDSWAEKFSEMVIRDARKITFFMELRAHHPQRFWTKLALAGLTQTIIGVEALSPPLLKNMNKGTQVIQNLTTQKYLQEMGVYSGSNLIMAHPKSTAEDIVETRRVVELIPHLPKLEMCWFWLDAGSPLFDSLSPEEVQAATPYFHRRLPGRIRDLVTSFTYHVPSSLTLRPELQKAWGDFKSWYMDSYTKYLETKPSLKVARADDGVLLIEDTRWKKKKTFVLDGLKAKIHDMCHAGVKFEAFGRLQAAPDRVLKALESMIADKLILKTGEHYLSLALRPRSELVAALNENQSALSQRAGSTEQSTAVSP